MTAARVARIALSATLVALLVGGLLIAVKSSPINKTRITAYFENSNGIYPGDEVRILGVPVGEIETIEPQPQRAKITFWVDGKYQIPADAKAVVISPTVVSARFIQLTPVYTTGPALGDDATIPKERTAVPVEWDDLRDQLDKLNRTLAPTHPGGVSTLGAFVTTAADNLRGQGAAIRDSVIKLSQTLSILGDHSGDLFGTLKNLSVLVSALHDSTDLMRELNQNLGAVTALLANDPNEVGTAVADLNTAVTDMRGFLVENRDSVGTTFDKLAEITQALGESSADLKQTLHVAPTGISNFINIYEPANARNNRRTVRHQLQQSAQLHLRGDSGRLTAGCRTVGEIVRPIPGPDIQEPAVQLPRPARIQRCARSAIPSRRRAGAAQRGHLQRGLDASGLRSARHSTAGRTGHRTHRRGSAARRGADRSRCGSARHDGAPRSRVMTGALRRRAATGLAALVLTAVGVSGCGWRGLNSLPLPGTEGGGPGSYLIQAQVPDVNNLEPNSRVRVGDVNVGNVTGVERQGWHALVTMRIHGGVELPANATAKMGQTSLLGSQHIELAPPTGEAPQGRLHDGSLIPLQNGGAYPTTEQALAAISLLLNGGGVGQLQDVVETFSTALRGREHDLRSLIEQLDLFVRYVNDQTDDIIDATDRLNRVVGTFADQKPVVDRALKTIPDALAVLRDERDHLSETIDQLGKFSAITADSVNRTKQSLVTELKDLAPVLRSAANAGPALTRSLSILATYPWPNETIENWVRGDYGNLTAVIDLTLSRMDASFLTGTRFEGKLTALEMQWGRTIGQLPSPYTAGNPLVAPYYLDQGR